MKKILVLCAALVALFSQAGFAYFSLEDDMRSYQILYQKETTEYINYYHVIREKILKELKRNYRSYYHNGDVNLFFILNHDGSLYRLDVDTAGSTKNRKLIDVAVLSIREASPFPSFPDTLDGVQLPFSLAVSFKNNDN
ncbi:MAG: hypothetical protein WC522_03230 [Candidatus Omnitrophota bacterium]